MPRVFPRDNHVGPQQTTLLLLFGFLMFLLRRWTLVLNYYNWEVPNWVRDTPAFPPFIFHLPFLDVVGRGPKRDSPTRVLVHTESSLNHQSMCHSLTSLKRSSSQVAHAGCLSFRRRSRSNLNTG